MPRYVLGLPSMINIAISIAAMLVISLGFIFGLSVTGWLSIPMGVITGFVIFVVLIGCGSGVLNNYLKNQREREKHALNEDVVDELSVLRERIEVLERIVTDEKNHLSKELDRLERQT